MGKTTSWIRQFLLQFARPCVYRVAELAVGIDLQLPSEVLRPLYMRKPLITGSAELAR